MRRLGCLLLVACLLLTSSALADIHPLELDQTVHGTTPLAEGWISEDEYIDESIHVVISHDRIWPLASKGWVGGHYARITIQDPSQLRTAMSQDSYDDERQDRPLDMAKNSKGVISCNADFMKYYYGVGYVVRQGEFYRNALDGTRDVLVIDENGDFTSVEKATKDSMKAHLDAMEKEGHTPVNTFTFGPVLVENGVAKTEQEIRTCPTNFEPQLVAQRIAICQLGELEYAIIMCEGGNGYGIRMWEFATWITEVFPECKLAYNLDGGNSAHMMVYDTAQEKVRVVHAQVGSRPLSDIIYFASIADPKYTLSH